MDDMKLTIPISEELLEIFDEDHRRLLVIHRDGTWEIQPEDVPEAARLFAEAVAQNLMALVG